MGITFDEATQQFIFDFEHDNAKDIIQLTGNGYQVEAFGKCFYYGYEFSAQVDSNLRSNFICKRCEKKQNATIHHAFSEICE